MFKYSCSIEILSVCSCVMNMYLSCKKRNKTKLNDKELCLDKNQMTDWKKIIFCPLTSCTLMWISAHGVVSLTLLYCTILACFSDHYFFHLEDFIKRIIIVEQVLLVVVYFSLPLNEHNPSNASCFNSKATYTWEVFTCDNVNALSIKNGVWCAIITQWIIKTLHVSL